MVAFRYQAFCKVEADEAGRAGDEDFVLWHCVEYLITRIGTDCADWIRITLILTDCTDWGIPPLEGAGGRLFPLP